MNQKSLMVVLLGVVGGVLLWLAFRNQSSTPVQPGTVLPGTAGAAKVSAASGLAASLASLFGKSPSSGAVTSATVPTNTSTGPNPYSFANETAITAGGNQELNAGLIADFTNPTPAAQAAAQGGSPAPIIAANVSTPPDLSFLGGQYANNAPLPAPVFATNLGQDAATPPASVTSFGNSTFDIPEFLTA